MVIDPPVTRLEAYLAQILEQLSNGNGTQPNIDPNIDIESAIQSAVNDYLDEHAMSLQSADSLIVTANGNCYSVVLTVEENHPKLIINEIEQEE